MPQNRQAKRQWVYRPTEAEHELLLKAMEMHPEYPSQAQFIREGVMRLIHGEDRRPLFTQLSDLIEEFREIKTKYQTLLLKNMEER